VDEVVEAPIVLLAAPWTRVQAILAGIRSWDQRILIDATNHFLNRKMELANLNGRSSSQLVAEWAPGARVVKALNTLYATDLAAGARVGKDRRVAFLSGDDASAKTARCYRESSGEKRFHLREDYSTTGENAVVLAQYSAEAWLGRAHLNDETLYGKF
jgi:hypothetical protein